MRLAHRDEQIRSCKDRDGGDRRPGVPRYLPRQDMDVDASSGVYSQRDKRYDQKKRACHDERSHHDERGSDERGRDTPDRRRSQLGSARVLLAGWILAVQRFN
jgi:hypothetical protein